LDLAYSTLGVIGVCYIARRLHEDTTVVAEAYLKVVNLCQITGLYDQIPSTHIAFKEKLDI
jgi:hypothetical protein